MTQKEQQTIKQTVVGLLEKGRLHEAMQQIGALVESAMLFELGDRVKQLRQTYGYMLRYLAEGANDPQRDTLLNNIIAECHDVLDIYLSHMAEKETSTLYYDTRRFNRRQPQAHNLAAKIQNWENARKHGRSLSALFADAKQNGDAAKTLENAEKELFTAIWTSYPLDPADATRITQIVTNPDTSTVTAIRLSSALFLSALQQADSAAISALCDIYTTLAIVDNPKENAVSTAVLVYIVLLLYKYRRRPFNTALTARIKALDDLKTWNTDIRLAFMEIVRTHDTARINRKMYEEILPDMINIQNDVMKKMKEIDADLENNENNPDWEELLSDSPIADKLKELNELQMEGSDLYMGSFGKLKNFPFFHDVVGWFTPFSAEAYDIAATLENADRNNNIYDTIRSLPYLCDSDKYSMYFSIAMMPQNAGLPVIDHLSAHRDEMDEMRKISEGLTRNDIRKTNITNIVRNLYRFFNLYRRKGEFHNILEGEVNLLDVEHLNQALEEPELLRLIAEFYFSRGYYRESLTAFLTLDKMAEFDAATYQKTGYAYQKTGDIDNAIRYYEQADLLDSGSRWLTMRLASAYRTAGRYDDAIQLLTRMNNTWPDDPEILLQLGFVYIVSDNCREALRHLSQAEFIDPDNTRVARLKAWTHFMLREFENSIKTYEKVITAAPKPEDYLNMGHASLALRNYKEAINYYKLYLNNCDNNKETLVKAIDTDRTYLRRARIDEKEISLIIDAVFSQIDD